MDQIILETTNPKQRIMLNHADYYDDPLAYTGIGATGIRHPRQYRSNISHGDVDNETTDLLREYLRKLEPEQAIRATNLHLAIFTDSTERLFLHKWRGYSQGDWLDFAISYDTADYVDNAPSLEDFDAWLSGDAYIAHLQEYVQVTSERGETWHEWRDIVDGSDPVDFLGSYWDQAVKIMLEEEFEVTIKD